MHLSTPKNNLVLHLSQLEYSVWHWPLFKGHCAFYNFWKGCVKSKKRRNYKKHRSYIIQTRWKDPPGQRDFIHALLFIGFIFRSVQLIVWNEQNTTIYSVSVQLCKTSVDVLSPVLPTCDWALSSQWNASTFSLAILLKYIWLVFHIIDNIVFFFIWNVNHDRICYCLRIFEGFCELSANAM